MIHVTPKHNWPAALADIISRAKPGDIIQVETREQVELAHRAMERMGVSRNDVAVEIGR